MAATDERVEEIVDITAIYRSQDSEYNRIFSADLSSNPFALPSTKKAENKDCVKETEGEKSVDITASSDDHMIAGEGGNIVQFCRWFNSEYGCKYGPKCTQRHHHYPPYMPNTERVDNGNNSHSEQEELESAAITDIESADKKEEEVESIDNAENTLQSLTSIMIELQDKLEKVTAENKKLQIKVQRHELLMNQMTMTQNQNHSEVQHLGFKMNENPNIQYIEYELFTMNMKYKLLEKQLKALTSINNDNADNQFKEESEEEKIRKWLNNINMSQYFHTFIDSGFDEFDMIADITMDDLNEMNIDKLGHKKKIIKYAQKLNQFGQNITNTLS